MKLESLFATSVALLLVGSTVSPLQGCCGGGEPDEVLQVEVMAEDASPASVDAGASEASLCGAEVIARAEDGEEVELEEVEEDGACVYRGTVDPEKIYQVMVSHPELGNAEDEVGSNPSCGPSESDATDGFVVLAAANGASDGGIVDEADAGD